MWAVHGGGFYHSNKYMVAPRWRPLPENLHWSYWESYSTWLTGFALFTALYLFNAGTFLVDKSVRDWSPAAAIAGSLGFLVAFWLVYDLICRAFGQRRNGDLIVGAGVLAFVVFASWLACQLVRRAGGLPAGGRDAGHRDERQCLLLDHPGAAQGDRAACARAEPRPDPRPARQAAQRAQHVLHAARHRGDAVQPLRLAVPGPPQLARCWCC
jgi:uncharacterized membrane protein